MATTCLSADENLLAVWLVKSFIPTETIAHILGTELGHVTCARMMHNCPDLDAMPYQRWQNRFLIYLGLSDLHRPIDREYSYTFARESTHTHPERVPTADFAALEARYQTLCKQALEIPHDFWDRCQEQWDGRIKRLPFLAARVYFAARRLTGRSSVRDAYAAYLRTFPSKTPESANDLAMSVAKFLDCRMCTYMRALEHQDHFRSVLSCQLHAWSLGTTWSSVQNRRPSLHEATDLDVRVWCYYVGILDSHAPHTIAQTAERYDLSWWQTRRIIRRTFRRFRHSLRWPIFVKLTWKLEPSDLFF